MDTKTDPQGAGRGRGPKRRALRWLGWAAGLVLLAAGGLAAVLAAVNLRDEPASADVHALESVLATARPVPADDDAVAGMVSLAAGRPDPTAADAGRESDAVDAAFGACDAPAGACAALLAEAEPRLPARIARDRALLDGYRALLGRRGWYEPLPPPDRPVGNAPPMGAVMAAQRLHLAQALLDARAGDVAAVRAALEADLRFWRGALAGSRTLMTKMVAARAVARHLEIGLLALERLPPSDAVAAVPPAWSEPLTAAERSLLPALASEWKTGDALMRWSQGREVRARGEAASLAWLFKLQATSNRTAWLMHRTAQVYGAPYREIPEGRRRLQTEVDERMRPVVPLYNPVGHALSSIAMPAYTSYGPRVTDLEALRRASLAVVGLHADGVPPAAAGAALAASAARDPYTGRAFEWDAPAGCVRFTRLDPAPGRGCIPYAPPTPTAGN